MQARFVLGCAVLWCAASAFADPVPAGVTASPPPSATVRPLSTQQERMKSCNADASARQLKGAVRRTYMQECLSGKPATAAAPPSTPQERMKSCNAEAGTKGLKGAERKAFMSSCLKAG